jgi:hypothetical protein
MITFLEPKLASVLELWGMQVSGDRGQGLRDLVQSFTGLHGLPNNQSKRIPWSAATWISAEI